jgi:glycosyltransferase involved in cell wall biosynthesis
VSVSHAVANHLSAAHNATSVVVSNGIAVPGPLGESWLRGAGLTPGSFVLFVGRLSEEKGCHDLIEAFQRESRPGLELVFAGGSTYADGYEERIRRMAGPRVRFLGWVDPAVLAELYAHCALFVLPSSLEGLSVALLEAMSHGAPCLVSDIPPNLEALEETGWSFRSGDAEHLAEQLSALLREPDLCRRLGAAARARVEQHFSWDAVARALERVYVDLISTNSRGLSR